LKFNTSPQFDSHWKDFPREHRELVKPGSMESSFGKPG